VDLGSEEKPQSFTTDAKIKTEIVSQELKRREFLKLSAVIAGGARAMQQCQKEMNCQPQSGLHK
jgi:hypothetical protein